MKKKFGFLLTIICCILTLSFMSIFVGNDIALAENSNISIDINSQSTILAYGDTFAVITGQKVYVIKDNVTLTYLEDGEFTVLDGVMNSKYIVLLVTNASGKALYYYEYTANSLKRFQYSNKNIFPENIVALSNDTQDTFYAIDQNKIIEFKLDSDSYKSNYNANNNLYTNITDFCIGDALYCLLDGNLYAIDENNFYYSDLSSFLAIEGDFIDITYSNGNVLLIDSQNVYRYIPSADEQTPNNVEVLLTGDICKDSLITSTYVSQKNTHYIYIKSDLPSINVYEFDGEAMYYYNTFDNTIYSHPTNYDLIQVYRANKETIIYSSPRHLQKLATIAPSEYFLVLTKVDEYYYVYFNDDNTQIFGYIPVNSDITICPANKKPAIGTTIQALHPNIVVYKYPFTGNGINQNGSVAVDYDVSIYTQLVVIDNVGEDGNFDWGWYKISYVKNDQIITGYVRHQDVSPYTQLTAPSISKTVKVTSQKLGEYVKVYILPDEGSLVVGELKEGSHIDLNEAYDPNSEWTKVVYNGSIAYIKTQNLHIEGLTSWQLALAITIPVVVIAIAITVIILLVVKRKKFLSRF